jgi:hypothetical protein
MKKMKRKRVERIQEHEWKHSQTTYAWWKKLYAYSKDAAVQLRDILWGLRGSFVPPLVEQNLELGRTTFSDPHGNIHLFTANERVFYVGNDGNPLEYPCDNRALWPWTTCVSPTLPADIWRYISTFLGMRDILALSQLNKEFDAWFRVDAAEPWVSYRRLLTRLIPPDLIGPSVRSFYAVTIRGIAKTKPLRLMTTTDLTIAACILFPFGQYGTGNPSYNEAFDFITTGHTGCGLEIVTVGRVRRGRRTLRVVFETATGAYRGSWGVSQKEIGERCAELTRCPRRADVILSRLCSTSTFSNLLEFKNAVAALRAARK